MMNSRHIIPMMIFISIMGCLSASYAETFQDALGRQITRDKKPERIIALAPSITETLYFLGLGDRVVGVTEYSYYPPEAAVKPIVGSYVDLNIEKIIELSPDLVIGTIDGNQPEIVDLLEQAEIRVYFINPRNIKDVIEMISEIGKLCGVSGKADLLSRQLNERIKRVRTAIKLKKKPLVFLQINLRPIMTVNKNTFLHDLIHLAGGINMTEDEPITYPRISLEEVVHKAPEVIIITSMEIEGRFEQARKEWMKWTSIPAVKNERVHLINSDFVDRPSPRIVEGLEIMARYIHPEVKWE